MGSLPLMGCGNKGISIAIDPAIFTVSPFCKLSHNRAVQKLYGQWYYILLGLCVNHTTTAGFVHTTSSRASRNWT